VLLDLRGQLAEPALEDQLVRPGRGVRHHARRVLVVGAGGQQLVLQLLGAGGRQEQRHRGAVLGEAADRLAGRHRRLAALEPGEHDRLRDLGDRQLALHDRRDGAEAAHARDDLGLEAERGAQLVLLLGAAPQRRVAGVDAGDQQALAAARS
jgi:hypothetical protein